MLGKVNCNLLLLFWLLYPMVQRMGNNVVCPVTPSSQHGIIWFEDYLGAGIISPMKVSPSWLMRQRVYR